MIDFRQAAKAAFASVQEMFCDPDVSGHTKISDMRLEEIERSEDESRWFITVSFLRPLTTEDQRTVLAPFAQVIGADKKRDYKSVEVDASTGEVRAIKIRQLEQL